MTRRIRVRIGAWLALAFAALVIAPGCGGGGGGCKDVNLGGFGGGVDVDFDGPPPPPIVPRVAGIWQGRTSSDPDPSPPPFAGVPAVPAQPLGPMRLTIDRAGRFTGTIRDDATGEEGTFAGTLKNYTEEGFYIDVSQPQGFSEGATLTFPTRRYAVRSDYTIETNGHLTGSLHLRDINATLSDGDLAYARFDLTKE